MKLVPLTRGYEAMVDDEDYDRIMLYKWQSLIVTDNCIYGVRSTWDKIRKRTGQTILLHNFIVPPPEGFTNDHIDRNGLNCQKANLRFATKAQQMTNRIRVKRTDNIYRGVFKNKKNWMVQLRSNGILYHGGTFKNEIEAAKIYDELAKKYHGEFAILNFPEEAQ